MTKAITMSLCGQRVEDTFKHLQTMTMTMTKIIILYIIITTYIYLFSVLLHGVSGLHVTIAWQDTQDQGKAPMGQRRLLLKVPEMEGIYTLSSLFLQA